MDRTQNPTAARRTFALVCGGFLAVGVILAGLGPTLPYLAAQVGQDVAALGGVFTALSAGVILAQFGVGPASDRFGQRPVLAAGLLLMGGGGLALTLSQRLVPLLACALLAGLGFGALLTAGNLLVARLFPRRSVAALNSLNLFFGVGSILGPAIAGLAGARLGMPQVGLWMGAAILAVLAPAILRYAAAPPPAQRDSAGPAGEPARAAGIWLLGLLLLCYTGIEIGFGGWVTLYLISSADLGPEAAALIASGFWLALTAGRGLGAILGLRLTPQTLLTTSLLGMLGGVALLGLSVGDRAGSVAGVLLLGLSCGPVFPTVLAVVTTATQGSATLTGRVLALGNGGGLIFPALLGLILRRHGPLAMSGTMLTVALVMVALCAAVVLRGAARPPAVGAQRGQEARIQ